MSAYTQPQWVTLESGDRDRLHRLTVEVLGRLEEMARIAARNLGLRLDGTAIRMFVPREIEQGESANVASRTDLPPFTHVEITEWPDGTSICVIYLASGGIILEHPCGLAG